MPVARAILLIPARVFRTQRPRIRLRELARVVPDPINGVGVIMELGDPEIKNYFRVAQILNPVGLL